MCLIVAKPRGVSMPGRKRLKRWFNQYHDGFGLAFQNEGKVRVLKGAMEIPEMFHVISTMRDYLAMEGKTPEDIDVVMQYRQAVTGSVCREYCHPFPVTKDRDDLNGLDVVADIALAHNGTIWQYNDLNRGQKSNDLDLNDAQEFIIDYVVDIGDGIWNTGVKNLIEEYTVSKFALLSGDKLDYIGEFYGEFGLFFSNLGYKQIKIKTSTKASSWYEYDSGSSSAVTKLTCPICGENHYTAYQLPEDDDEPPVCYNCFRTFTGRLPNADDRAW